MKHILRLLVGACVGLTLNASHAGAQWSTAHGQAPLKAPHNGAFRDRYAAAERLLNAFEYADARRYEALWSESRARASALEVHEFARLTRELFVDPPRLRLAPGVVEREFAKLVPEAVAMLAWHRNLMRQAYDVLADPALKEADRNGRIAELVAYYRYRREAAVSARPRSFDALDGQFHSLAFRREYPKFNGLAWATRWLTIALYESLVTGDSPAERERLVTAALDRFRQLIRNPPETTPYTMPLSPVIAPAFARRFPELAAILDNANMLQEVFADILVAREVPRSAKRQDILRAANLFRSDTTFATTYETWLGAGALISANNMGGLAVGFGDSLPRPTIVRGMSMAGVMPRAAAPAAAEGGMAGMDHGDMPGMSTTAAVDVSGLDADALAMLVQRMMADPVIRERVATDPAIRQLLGDTAGVGRNAAAADMSGMDHANMPGMSPAAAANPPAGPPMTEARRQAIDFAVQLLSDPAVEARVQSDPELRKLWSDPDVQRRLAELRRTPPARSGAQPPSPPRP